MARVFAPYDARIEFSEEFLNRALTILGLTKIMFNSKNGHHWNCQMLSVNHVLYIINLFRGPELGLSFGF